MDKLRSVSRHLVEKSLRVKARSLGIAESDVRSALLIRPLQEVTILFSGEVGVELLAEIGDHFEFEYRGKLNRQSRSKLPGNARLLQNGVCCVAGNDGMVNGKAPLGNRTISNFVISTSRPLEVT